MKLEMVMFEVRDGAGFVVAVVSEAVSCWATHLSHDLVKSTETLPPECIATAGGISKGLGPLGMAVFMHGWVCYHGFPHNMVTHVQN